MEPLDEFEDVLGRLGAAHRIWLKNLWDAYTIEHEPILAADGQLVAEPQFWFKHAERIFACFGKADPGPYTLHKLDDHDPKIEIVQPGQTLPYLAKEQ